MVVAFALFYILAVGLVMSNYGKQRELLIFTLIVLTFLIGFREGWPDESVYQIAFKMAPYPWEFSWDIQPFGYAETGYLFLASIIKTFVNSDRFYLIVMGALSMYLLYKCLYNYCALPLIGLCDYIARFLLPRDFTQMRSSLVMLMIILALKFVKEKKMWKYFLVILLGYQFHHMALIGLPFYFFGRANIGKKTVIFGVLLAIVLSQTLATAISGYVEDYSQDLQYTTYTQGNYVDDSLGLRNPMIWFQVAILFYFTFNEKKYKNLTPYYNIFRSGYFYSTLILILFCNYTALSGRTSTMFATVEMYILPLIVMGEKRSNRAAYLLAIGAVLVYFFFSKYTSFMSEMKGVIEIMPVEK